MVTFVSDAASRAIAHERAMSRRPFDPRKVLVKFRRDVQEFGNKRIECTELTSQSIPTMEEIVEFFQKCDDVLVNVTTHNLRKGLRAVVYLIRKSPQA